MKNLLTPFKLLAIALLFSTFIFSSCVKQEFDEPETANVDPALTANKTMAELQAMAMGNVPTLINSDVIISGIVVADDASGNFYKTLILQDSSAGIAVQIDMSNFSTSYPIGRRVFIKCKGLYIAKDKDFNFELGYNEAGAIGRIPQSLVPQYVVPGQWGLPVTPVTVTINSIPPTMTNRLIKIENVEFQSSDTAQTYADAANLSSISRIIKSCSPMGTLKLYTSGYAHFAGELTPGGYGSIIGIYTVYSGAGELQIRDVSDVNMPGDRCEGAAILKTIQDVKDIAPTSGTLAIPANWTIKGTIISDIASGNITSRNIVVQDGAAGIVVRFTANNTSLLLNDSVAINIGGGNLSYYQTDGVLQLDLIPNANAVKIGTGSITPTVVSISQLHATPRTYESTLVKVTGVTFPAGTYSGNKVITQSSTTITMYTSSLASFAAATMPSGSHSVTAIVNIYNSDAEVNLRNTNDVQ